MKRIPLLFIFILITQNIQSQCKINSQGKTISTLTKSAWGQSFQAECSGKLSSITFNSAKSISSSATLSIYQGKDCESDIIYSQSISSLKNGDNSIVLNKSISVRDGNIYYFKVQTDNKEGYKIRFSDASNVNGNLKTYFNNKSSYSCSWEFTNYDWDFSININNEQPTVSHDHAGSKDLDLFIWAGQSNAQGTKGDGAQYPSDPKMLDNKIKLYYEYISNTHSNGWIKMQAQDGIFTEGHFGAEVNFSRKLKEKGYNPAIFKYTKGSTSLNYDWKLPNKGGYYDSMITKLKKSIHDLEEMGYNVTIRGLIWIQGESDAGNYDSAKNYHSNLLSIINHFRNHVANNSRLPIILGVDEQHHNIVNQPLVLDAHHSIAENDNFIEFTSMFGLPKADGTHLTPQGLISHGLVIYKSFMQLIDDSPQDTNQEDPILSQCYINSSGNNISSLIKNSWGQSFQAECSGKLSSITFNSASHISTSAKLSIYNGTDCDGTIIHKQSISSLSNGNNSISLNKSISLKNGNYYYFKVHTDNGVGFKIRFSGTNQIVGNLKTYFYNKSSTSCDWNFSKYDWNCSINITDNDPNINEEDMILSQCYINSSGNNISSLIKSSWGQSFQAECSGKLSSITFNSASHISTSATLSIYNGADCNGTIIHTQPISSLKNGDNSIVLNKSILLRNGNNYYFKVRTNNGIGYQIRFSDSNKVSGNLKTYFNNKSSTSCNWNFSNYDWNFSVDITDEPNNFKSNIKISKLSSENLKQFESQSPLSIFPNPTSGLISIKTDMDIEQAEIYSTLGKRIKIIYSDFNSILLDDLNHGLYFLKIKTDTGYTTKRIFKN